MLIVGAMEAFLSVLYAVAVAPEAEFERGGVKEIGCHAVQCTVCLYGGAAVA